MKVEKVNEKYKQIYEKQMTKTAPQSSNDMCIDAQGNVTPAVPLGYDDESKFFSAVTEVIQTAALDKDYVCWSNGGYTSKHPLNTNTGDQLKIYDPVLILDNFGYPLKFMMFTGEYEIDGTNLIPHFVYIYDDDVRNYKPKCYFRDKNTSPGLTKLKKITMK